MADDARRLQALETAISVLTNRVGVLERESRCKSIVIVELQARVMQLEEGALDVADQLADAPVEQLHHVPIVQMEDTLIGHNDDMPIDQLDDSPVEHGVHDESDRDSVIDLTGADNDTDKQDDQALVDRFDLQDDINSIPASIHDHLHSHQRVGAAFLHSVISNDTGVVFADALGLGKTLQMLTALYMTWRVAPSTRILVVMPGTLLPHWVDEVHRFNGWLTGNDDLPFTEPFLLDSTVPLYSRTEKIEPWTQRGGLLFLSYGMYRELMELRDTQMMLCVDPGAQILVLDEGHKICNPKTSNHACLSLVRTKRRIVISGYPLQNHLRELYTLIEFVNRPACLDLFKSYRQFQTLFEHPIQKLRSKNISKARSRAYVLYEQLRAHRLFLRRSGSLLQKHLPARMDIVLSIRMSAVQRQLWINFLERRTGIDGISTHAVATMISDHPEIAKRQAVIDPKAPCREWLTHSISNEGVGLEASGKLVVLMSLIAECKAAGDKIVVFSRWIKALSFLEEMIERYNVAHPSKPDIRALRFDGNTSMTERQSLINDFMSKTSTADCFLISTLCGEGISLIAANRAVVLEVNWNPSIDFQAASRVFRLGQTKPVFIYRLIMHDMFEEMVWRRQLEKIEMTNWVVDGSAQELSGGTTTVWADFLKAPRELCEIRGPADIGLSSLAQRDRVTRRVLEAHALAEGDIAGANDAKWIIGATEQDNTFTEFADFDEFSELDPVMAHEEYEYDRVYPLGTPLRPPSADAQAVVRVDESDGEPDIIVATPPPPAMMIAAAPVTLSIPPPAHSPQVQPDDDDDDDDDDDSALTLRTSAVLFRSTSPPRANNGARQLEVISAVSSSPQVQPARAPLPGLDSSPPVEVSHPSAGAAATFSIVPADDFIVPDFAMPRAPPCPKPSVRPSLPSFAPRDPDAASSRSRAKLIRNQPDVRSNSSKVTPPVILPIPLNLLPVASRGAQSFPSSSRFSSAQSSAQHGEHTRQLEALKNPDHFAQLASQRKRAKLESDQQRSQQQQRRPAQSRPPPPPPRRNEPPRPRTDRRRDRGPPPRRDDRRPDAPFHRRPASPVRGSGGSQRPEGERTAPSSHHRSGGRDSYVVAKSAPAASAPPRSSSGPLAPAAAPAAELASAAPFVHPSRMALIGRSRDK